MDVGLTFGAWRWICHLADIQGLGSVGLRDLDQINEVKVTSVHLNVL